MTPSQCREARTLLGISRAELADLAILPQAFVAYFEEGAMMLVPADLEALTRALERAGVEFIEGGAKVRKGG